MLLLLLHNKLVITVIIIIVCLNFSYSFQTIRRCYNKRAAVAKLSLQKRGLLFNISDITTSAATFSEEISLKESVELLKEREYIYNICWDNAERNVEKLDKNLKNMLQKATVFMESDQLWNRNQLVLGLEDIISKKGNFVCLVGGKSTGKSLVGKKMKERFQEKVFIANLRDDPSILSCLFKELREYHLKYKSTPFGNAILKTVGGMLLQLSPLKNIIAPDDFKSIFDAVQEQPSALSTLLNDMATNLGGITVIVDEANLAFTITEDCTTPAQIQDTKNALALFTKLTKENKKASDILFIK